MSKQKLLLVEDEPAIRSAIRDYFSAGAYQVCDVESIERARQVFEYWRPDAAILDYSLPDGNALELIRSWRARGCFMPVIVLTGHGTIDLAVQAIKSGAEHFLTKPVQLQTLMGAVQGCLQNSVSSDAQVNSKATPQQADPFVGESATVKRLAAQARKVATGNGPVLLQGETGAGKGVLAKWLHASSGRAEKPFVDLNCAGLSYELLESELFGHEKGAFTGALNAKPGLFEAAEGGTIFLDEIGDADLRIQAKLLKAIEEKRFRRLGENRERQVDVRLIAATHRDLKKLVAEGKFRSDLYYRISAFPLLLPSLRQRPDDIPALAEIILDRLAAELNRPGLHLTQEAVSALRRHSWPGNIRELRNTLEWAALMVSESAIRIEDLRFEAVVDQQWWEQKEALTLEEIEREYLLRILKEQDGHVTKAAEKLGISRSTLYTKLRTYGMTGKQGRVDLLEN